MQIRHEEAYSRVASTASEGYNNSDTPLMQQLVRGLLPLRPRTKNKERKDVKMKEEKKRTHCIKIRVSEEELAAFKRKFNNSGMKTFSGFLRAMVLDGHIVHFDEKELFEINRLAANISANITQIAYCAERNSYDYEKEFSEIKESTNKIWEPLRFFIGLNMKTKH